jgi:hypothetical protein
MATSALAKKIGAVTPAPVPPAYEYTSQGYAKPVPGAPTVPKYEPPPTPLPPPPRLPGPEPGPSTPKLPDLTPPTTAPRPTGNPRADILGLLQSKYPGARPADLQAAMAEIQAMYPGTTLVGDDKIRLPDGRVIDVGLSFGAGGGVGWAWQEGFYNPGTSATYAGTLARQASPASNEIQSAFQQALLQLLWQRPNVDPEALRQGAPFQAYQLGAQRASERDLAEAAERASYEGYADSGAAETERAGIRQRRGEGESAFLGNLAVGELAAQRQQLQFALQTAAALGDAESTRELQRELADLDATIQRERLGFNYDQLQADMNYRAAELMYR